MKVPMHRNLINEHLEKHFRSTWREMSTETLIEQVQSVVLEIKELEPEQNHTQMLALAVSANQVSVE